MALMDLTQECHEAAEGKLPLVVVGPDGRRTRRMRVQVFKNNFLESFAQAHPITPGVWFGPFVVYGLYAGFLDFSFLVLPLFLAGVLITTLIEYCLHRFLFHMKPHDEKSRVQHFLLHGYHHDFPNDPMRLVLPPIGIWPVAAVVGVLYWVIFGQYFWPLFAGTAAGYIAYDWMHYYTHHGNPKGGPGRFIKRYHMLHHHDSPEHRYGITSPLWDVIFGTYLPLKKLVRQGGRHASDSEITKVGEQDEAAKKAASNQAAHEAPQS
jgi:sterol desaturase/sphingolipid hydroxylase (fatty acid hydroxylase superfamily)